MKETASPQSTYALGHSKQELERLSRQAQAFEPRIIGDGYQQPRFLSRIRLSRFLSNAPPPVNTMPRSLMSAESSGGVRSSATRTVFTIVATHSFIALREPERPCRR